MQHRVSNQPPPSIQLLRPLRNTHLPTFPLCISQLPGSCRAWLEPEFCPIHHPYQGEPGCTEERRRRRRGKKEREKEQKKKKKRSLFLIDETTGRREKCQTTTLKSFMVQRGVCVGVLVQDRGKIEGGSPVISTDTNNNNRHHPATSKPPI